MEMADRRMFSLEENAVQRAPGGVGYVNRPRKSNPPDSDVGAGTKDHEGGRHGARRCESTSLGRMDLPDPWCDVTGGGEPTSIPGQCDDSLGTTQWPEMVSAIMARMLSPDTPFTTQGDQN